MRICLLTPVLDAFKGGNHLPLLGAMPEVRFMILTNHAKPKNPELPPNVTVVTIDARLGPYYYGCVDWMFARAVLTRYPVSHPFWKQFDVIHLNQTMGPALLTLAQTEIPLLFLIHHPVSVDRQVAIDESSFFGGILWRLKYAMLARWQKKFCNVLPHIVTVSQASADRIAVDYGCGRGKITIVPNGVDGGEFTPGDLTTSGFDVIALGSFLHPRKGFPYLLSAYRMLAQKGYRIADVGRRSNDQQAALRSIPEVQMFGMVGHERLIELLRQSSVLLSTSLYEGFGLSLVEALACGRPAVAFDAGATSEVLTPVDPSLVVPLRNVDTLTGRVEEFLRLSPSERAKKGEQYREAVVRLYPLAASARTLRDLYESITSSLRK